jgi:hypothetical protein
LAAAKYSAPYRFALGTVAVGGLNIYCGSFKGQEKSGSALEGVLDALDAPACVVDAMSGFINGEYMLIPEETAKLLLPLLAAYRSRLIADIGHDDWKKEARAEEEAGLDRVEARHGESRGWRLYCVTDLIRACETSIAEHEEIALVTT